MRGDLLIGRTQEASQSCPAQASDPTAWRGEQAGSRRPAQREQASAKQPQRYSVDPPVTKLAGNLILLLDNDAGLDIKTGLFESVRNQVDNPGRLVVLYAEPVASKDSNSPCDRLAILPCLT
jgi:hypothetical protein